MESGVKAMEIMARFEKSNNDKDEVLALRNRGLQDQNIVLDLSKTGGREHGEEWTNGSK